MKRTDLVEQIKVFLCEEDKEKASAILATVEGVMEPKLRPLNEVELEEHPLVKQAHQSKKHEVKVYVKALEYEWVRKWED